MGGANSSSNSKATTTNQSTVSSKCFSGVGNLIKLLPTGTIFLFQFLNPVLTHNGNCNPINKYLTLILIGACAFSCAFSSFTDSYIGSDGNTHYGIATKKGLWSSQDNETKDLSAYRLRFGDFVHAFFSLNVFLVVAILDLNTVGCFYPNFVSTQKVLLMLLPPVIGAVSGVVFMLFPNKRHGIGYPST